MFFEEPFERHVTPDLGIQHELDTHSLHQLATPLHDFLFQLEGRNPEGEQAADL